MDIGYVILLLLVAVYGATSLFLYLRAKGAPPPPVEPPPEEKSDDPLELPDGPPQVQ